MVAPLHKLRSFTSDFYQPDRVFLIDGVREKLEDLRGVCYAKKITYSRRMLKDSKKARAACARSSRQPRPKYPSPASECVPTTAKVPGESLPIAIDKALDHSIGFLILLAGRLTPLSCVFLGGAIRRNPLGADDGGDVGEFGRRAGEEG